MKNLIKDIQSMTWRWGDIRISKWKSFEYQFEGRNCEWNKYFECKFKWTCKQDHAGIDFYFSLFKLFWMNLNIHDRRHWDYENNCWKVYDEK